MLEAAAQSLAEQRIVPEGPVEIGEVVVDPQTEPQTLDAFGQRVFAGFHEPTVAGTLEQRRIDRLGSEDELTASFPDPDDHCLVTQDQKPFEPGTAQTEYEVSPDQTRHPERCNGSNRGLESHRCRLPSENVNVDQERATGDDVRGLGA